MKTSIITTRTLGDGLNMLTLVNGSYYPKKCVQHGMDGYIINMMILQKRITMLNHSLEHINRNSLELIIQLRHISILVIYRIKEANNIKIYRKEEYMKLGTSHKKSLRWKVGE